MFFGDIFMLMRLDRILDGARNVLELGARRGQEDIQRTREAFDGIGGRIKGAVSGLSDDVTYAAAQVAPRGVKSYSDSRMGYGDWRTLKILEEQSSGASSPLTTAQVDYFNRKFEQMPEAMPTAGGQFSDAAINHLGRLDNTSMDALLQARRQADAELAQGQTFYDPRTQAMMAQADQVRARAADPVAYDTRQRQALGSFLQNYDPETVMVQDDAVIRAGRPQRVMEQDASWYNNGRTWG